MDALGGVPREPLSLNKYAYANGNPVMYSDPAGRFAGLSGSTASLGVMASLATISFGTLNVFGFEESDEARRLQRQGPGLQAGDRNFIMKRGEKWRGPGVRKTIEKYRSTIETAAAINQVDANLIRAIIFEEQTHRKPFEGAAEALMSEDFAEMVDKGLTVGLGQITQNAHGYSRSELRNPITNIQAIAVILSRIQKQPLIDPRYRYYSVAYRYNGSGAHARAYGRRVAYYRRQFIAGWK